MTYTDRVRIQKEVTMGKPGSIHQSDEEKQYREAITREVQDMKGKGIVPNFPCDWEAENL